jgi:ATP-dependent Clp protease ATP-binding subunit ClpC
LGLVKDEDAIAARILIDLGVTLPKLRSAVEYVVGRGNGNNPTGMRMTRDAERVIKFAIEEARQMGHDFIDSEHVLLGILRESDSVAAGVLDAFGVTLEKARPKS